MSNRSYGFTSLPSSGNNNNNNNMMMMMGNNNNNNNNSDSQLFGNDPQYTQTSLTLSQNTALGLTPSLGNNNGVGGGAVGMGGRRRLIVKEPELTGTSESLKTAIAKISKDNAWSIPLPAAHSGYLENDVLGEFFNNNLNADGSSSSSQQQQGGANATVNHDHFKKFTRAATFVEQSSKVWAHRVDSTHMLSIQMLNRLRSGAGAGDDGDDDGSPGRHKHKKHKNRALQRTVAESETEINVEGFDIQNAGLKGLRVTYGAMFAAMTQKFDQGFKGLLLNNAPIGREGNPYLDRDFGRPEYAHLYNTQQQQYQQHQQQQGQQNQEDGNGDDATNLVGAETDGVRVSGVLLKSLVSEGSSSSSAASPNRRLSQASPSKYSSSNNNSGDQLPPLVPGSNTSGSSSVVDGSSSSLNQSNIDRKTIDDFEDDGIDNFDDGYNDEDFNQQQNENDGEEPNPSNNKLSSARFSFQANNKNAMQSNSTLSRAASVANQLSRAQSVANESLSKLQQDAFQNMNAQNILNDAQELATGMSSNHNRNNYDDDDEAFYGDNDDGGFYDDDDGNNNNNRLSTSGHNNNMMMLNNSTNNNNNNPNASVIALAAEDGAGGWAPLNHHNTSTSSAGSGGGANNNNSSAYLRFGNPAQGNAVLKTIRKGTKIGNTTEAILSGVDDLTKAAKKGMMMLNKNKNNNRRRGGRGGGSDDEDDDDADDRENKHEELLQMMGLNSTKNNNNSKAVTGSKKTTAFESSLNLDELRNFDQVFSAKLRQCRLGQNLVDPIPDADKLMKDYTKTAYTKDRAIEKKLLLPRASAADQDQLAWWFPRQTARDTTTYYQPICAPEAHNWNLLSKYVATDGTVTTKDGGNNNNGGGAEGFGDDDDFGADDFGGYDGDDDDVQQDEQFADGVFGGGDDLGENFADNGDLDGNNNDGFVNAQDLLNEHNNNNADGEGSGRPSSVVSNKNADLLKLIEPPATIDLGQFVIPAALVQINVVRLRACMWKHLERIASLDVTAEHWQSILDHKDIQGDLRRDAAKAQGMNDRDIDANDDDEDNLPLVVPAKNAAGKRMAPVTERRKIDHLPEPQQTRPACVFSEVVLAMLPEVPTFVRGGSLAPAFFFFSLLFLANEKALLMVPMRIAAKKNAGSTHCEDVLVLMPPIG